MKLHLQIAVFLLLIAGDVRAAEICFFSPNDALLNSPKFSDFATRAIKIQRPAPVDTSRNKDVRLLRTALRHGAAMGPDFAGHFKIVMWGCGSSCVSGAIIDELTGRVTFASDISDIWKGHVDWDGDKLASGDTSAGGALWFRHDSNLLIVSGMPREDEAKDGVHFLRWDGKAFVPLKFVPASKICRHAN